MTKKKYNKRTWLNSEKSSSTGSLCCFYGEVQWNSKDDPTLNMFLEMADCHCKVRVHKCADDSLHDYIKKMKTISTQVDKYITFLEKQSEEML